MRFKESIDRKVVSLANAESIGKVSHFVVDVPEHKISAMKLRKTDDKHRAFVVWGSISAFGDDAVTVADAAVLAAGDETLEKGADKHHQLIGKLALSTLGDELGVVSDVEFDPATGVLLRIQHTHGSTHGDGLVGIGSYAAVLEVTAD